MSYHKLTLQFEAHCMGGPVQVESMRAWMEKMCQVTFQNHDLELVIVNDEALPEGPDLFDQLREVMPCATPGCKRDALADPESPEAPKCNICRFEAGELDYDPLKDDKKVYPHAGEEGYYIEGYAGE